MRSLFKKNMYRLCYPSAIFCILLCFAFFLLANPAFAQTYLEEVGVASGLPQTDIAILVARIIRIFLGVVGIILVCLLVYAGYLYFTARGEKGPIDTAHKIFKQAGIGIVIIFFSFSIATWILDQLLAAAGMGSVSSEAAQYTEPLSGSLGAGIVGDHYPERDATDIPRNTNIFVTFKEPIDPATIIDAYEDEPTSTRLDTGSVKIYETAKGVSSALASNAVAVAVSEDFQTFVFNPVEYLGSATEDVNYTVFLTSAIKKLDGEDAFVGAYSGGYAWTFEVSTEIDLTPPYVTFVIPTVNTEQPRNVTIEMSFSEAMNPVASTGSYIAADKKFFKNIEVFQSETEHVEGTFEISNGYRTVSFTTTLVCGEDPCGDEIYCLPAEKNITTIGHAASIDASQPPQALPVGVSYDGLVDAAGNSLDGNNDDKACGSSTDAIVCEVKTQPNDDYSWKFNTTDEINSTVPKVVKLDPNILQGEISQTTDVSAVFNTYIAGNSLDSTSVSLWPDPFYEMWFTIRKVDNQTSASTTVQIGHPTFVSTSDGGWEYWPVISSDVKSIYQICMYPSMVEKTSCLGTVTSQPYCCNGQPSSSECATDSGSSLPLEPE